MNKFYFHSGPVMLLGDQLLEHSGQSFEAQGRRGKGGHHGQPCQHGMVAYEAHAANRWIAVEQLRPVSNGHPCP
jgi:hypothetical protein